MPEADQTSHAFIPFALPSIGEEEIRAVTEVMRTGWLTTGPKARQFETDFSAFVGAGEAIAVNSATAGLHLALECLGIGPGDKVLTTPYTFTATAEVIRYLGADPVFADIDPRTFNIDPAAVRDGLAASGAKALVPVHFAGQACEMDELFALARHAGCAVVSDAAHSLPTTYKGRMVGALGDDITVFSFYATKTLCTGEGGMMIVPDAERARRCRTMRLHGINRDVFDRYRSKLPAWYYEVVAPGFKYNLPDLAAAIGIEQLKKVETMRLARAAIARRYDEAFRGMPLVTPFVVRPEDKHSWHLYVLQLRLEDLRINRDQFIEEMSKAGVGCSVHFIPLHRQPYWRDTYGLKPDDFPVADAVYQRAVSLPIYPGMSADTVERVVGAVRQVLERHAR